MPANEGNIVLKPGEGKIIPVPGHNITHKLRGEDTGGAFSLLEVDMFGDGPPQHIHKTEDETFYVLEGEINVLVGKDIINHAGRDLTRHLPVDRAVETRRSSGSNRA